MYNSARSQWQRNIRTQDLAGLAQSIWGPDAEGMMQSFQPTDAMLMKYQHVFLDGAPAIHNQTVLDLGAGNGLWSYVALREGARAVWGIEPRGQFVTGMNRWAEAKSLPIQFMAQTHLDTVATVQRHSINTVIMMGIETHTLGWEHLMWSLSRTDCEWCLLQASTVPDTDDQGLGHTQHVLSHNDNLRSGINLDHARDPVTGFQHTDAEGNYQSTPAEVIYSYRSKRYMRHLLPRVGWHIVKDTEQSVPAQQTVSESAQEQMYHWFVLRNQRLITH